MKTNLLAVTLALLAATALTSAASGLSPSKLQAFPAMTAS
jgi:hypothetical protein